MLARWERYLSRFVETVNAERAHYVYPVTDWDTDKGIFKQDPNKVKTEKSMISRLTDGEWDIALDFGCGPGAHFHLFDGPAREHNLLIGIDPDCTRAKLAQNTAQKIFNWIDFQIVCGGIQILENAPAELKVDRILCSQVLGHVPEEQIDRILKIFHHVLDSEGKCAVLIPVIGEKFIEHPTHCKGWNGESDYTHIVDVSKDPSDNEFREYIPPDEFDLISSHPKKNLLPVRSFLLPEFPDPESATLPFALEKIPPTFDQHLQNCFEVEDTYLYSIHRDTPDSNYPVADIILFLKNANKNNK